MPSGEPSRRSPRLEVPAALLGPPLIVLVEVEGLFVIADYLDMFEIRDSASGAGAAIALFVVVGLLAGQGSIALWRRALVMRERRLRLCQQIESKLAKSDEEALNRGDATNWVDEISETERAGRLGRAPVDMIRRFGLEPTWAYRSLESAGVPEALAISDRASLRLAKQAGSVTAALVAAVMFLVLSISVSRESPTPQRLVLVVGASGLMALQIIASRASLLHLTWALRETSWLKPPDPEHYVDVEALLELRRFDLYRLLSLQVPTDVDDEQRRSLVDWRTGDRHVKYEHSAGNEHGGGGDMHSDVRSDVDNLVALLRGPELVSYDGLVSWALGSRSVELAFAGRQVFPGDSASLNVSGSLERSHAPFDLTANSMDVTLVQTRASVEAPTDGSVAGTAFEFTDPLASSVGGRDPIIWIEVRQRGRFIARLRIGKPVRDVSELGDAGGLV